MRHALPYLLSLLAAGAVAFPILRINPTRIQSDFDLSVGHTLVTWNPLLTAVLLTLGIVLSWASATKLKSKAARFALVLPILVLAGSAVAARQNVYEAMFAPLAEKPNFEPVMQADFLSDHDLVLGIEVGEHAAAYPVGIVGYHHIVNDRLADEPFVVTY